MSISNHQISIIFVLRGGGGGVRPIILENSILSYGLIRKDMSRWFWVRVYNVAHVRPRSKMEPKIKIYSQGDRALKVSFVSKKKTFSKSDEKFTELCQLESCELK